MSVALSTLVTRLQAAVAARSSVPSTDQYTLAVKDAVRAYSRRRPYQNLATLSIVSGTATYTLPTDFLRVIRLESLWSPDGVLVTGAGLIPTNTSYEETYYIIAGSIRFDPEPTYTVDRDLWYAAGHVLNGSDAYPNMTDEDADIVMLQARANALRYQADAIAGDILSYAIGDEKVEKSKTVDATMNAVEGLEAEFERRIRAAIGPVGQRAAYTQDGR